MFVGGYIGYIAQLDDWVFYGIYMYDLHEFIASIAH